MRVCENKAHLTYCLNVHPAETWNETFASIRTYALQVRDSLGYKGPFGLGLRLSNQATIELQEMGRLEELKSFMLDEDLYVFTINGFPYGPFHGCSVKQDVYKPDWRARERVDYTLRLIDILAELLPADVTGSISTVPCSYKSWIESDDDRELMVKHLLECVEHMERTKSETGRKIQLALEPEPDCYLESSDDVIEFFARPELQSESVKRHLGVCFDTCHLSVGYEDLEESLAGTAEAGILVSKIQISSAIKRKSSEKDGEVLGSFNDDVYLHQVKGVDGSGRVKAWADLPDYLDGGREDCSECRVHCHVPLYFDGNESLMSTSSDLTTGFFRKVQEYGIEHLEIETYTFNVLPEYLKEKGITESIAEEYRWVLERIS